MLRIHTAHSTRHESALLAMTAGGHMAAEVRVEPEPEMSLAAGMLARAEGHRDCGLAHVEAARAQYAQAGTDIRAPRGAPCACPTGRT